MRRTTIYLFAFLVFFCGLFAGDVLAQSTDFNGDGRADMMWRNGNDGRNIVWLMNGGVRTDAILTNSVTDFSWQLAGTGDFDGDGKSDLYWRNKDDGRNLMWFMNGGARSGQALAPTAGNLDWTVAATRDFDGDNKDDILWRTSDGRNILWFMDGGYRKGAELTYSVTNPAWSLAVVDDFNGDNKADILWRNSDDGRNILWLMNGASRTKAVLINSVTDYNWELQGSGDFDGDGKADLFWRNKVDGRNLLWFMNGGSRKGQAMPPTAGNLDWEIASLADFDGDLKCDILWRTADGRNIFWFMDGATRHDAKLTNSVSNMNWELSSLASPVAENIQISFSLNKLSPTSTRSVRVLSVEQEKEPNELIYCSLTERHLQRIKLETNPILLDLPKDNIYLFAFVYNPTLDGILDQRIEVLGSIKISSNGIIALPVSRVSENKLDLGELSYNDHSFVSNISGIDLSRILGYSDEVLEQFGRYKAVANWLLNPDINQNGQYDQDENFGWEARSVNFFSWNPLNFDDLVNGYDTAVINQVTSTFTHVFHVILWGNISHGGSNDTILEYLSPTGWLQVGHVDDMFDDSGSRVDPDGSHTYTFINDLIEIGGIKGPWDGSYRIVHPEQTYFFNNMTFNQPYNTDSLLIFPFFAPVDNGTDYYNAIQWKWKGISNGSITDVSSEIIELICMAVDFRLNTDHPETVLFIDSRNSEGTMDISPTFTKEGLSNNTTHLVGTYEDFGKTLYQAWNQEQF